MLTLPLTYLRDRSDAQGRGPARRDQYLTFNDEPPELRLAQKCLSTLPYIPGCLLRQGTARTSTGICTLYGKAQVPTLPVAW